MINANDTDISFPVDPALTEHEPDAFYLAVAETVLETLGTARDDMNWDHANMAASSAVGVTVGVEYGAFGCQVEIEVNDGYWAIRDEGDEDEHSPARFVVVRFPERSVSRLTPSEYCDPSRYNVNTCPQAGA